MELLPHRDQLECSESSSTWNSPPIDVDLTISDLMRQEALGEFDLIVACMPPDGTIGQNVRTARTYESLPQE